MHKAQIIKWLRQSVAVVCDLSDSNLKISVESGNGVLFVPDDIFQVFKRRSIIEYSERGDFYFFMYPCDAGDSIIKIEPLDTLQKGLSLCVQTDDKKTTTN